MGVVDVMLPLNIVFLMLDTESAKKKGMRFRSEDNFPEVRRYPFGMASVSTESLLHL